MHTSRKDPPHEYIFRDLEFLMGSGAHFKMPHFAMSRISWKHKEINEYCQLVEVFQVSRGAHFHIHAVELCSNSDTQQWHCGP